MKVARVETFLVGRDWNNLVIARVHTDTGLSGLGEGTMQWQARTVATAIAHMAERYVLGASPFAIERLVQAMYRNEYARGGPVLNSAIAAIEFALWDICGKALGQPVHNLLGGRVHDEIPAYANGWFDPEGGAAGAAAAARRVVAAGYSGLKFDPFWGLGRDPAPAPSRAVFFQPRSLARSAAATRRHEQLSGCISTCARKTAGTQDHRGHGAPGPSGRRRGRRGRDVTPEATRRRRQICLWGWPGSARARVGTAIPPGSAVRARPVPTGAGRR